ncbi:hypothetical protein A7X95_05780 [Candidatus Nitrosopelagicus brevis]|uniref:Phosphoesterase n=2 Tax=Candidatus Nitrosopelagicus brevis TaxID=1410606 RepID=A0A0A7V3D9_9ARCH|nr:phosphodiesterase family protein [Candidatus Nitrosopelagicus brevis]PTL87401.1 hypothetical protein A7X95_05780 [Candidatus Nitrosopelagicus brevis]
MVKTRTSRMKIGIISDTHDDILNTNKAIDIFSQNNVSIVIHVGDFVAPPVVTEFKRLSKDGVKIIGVLGNNDGEEQGLKEEFEGINGELFKEIGKIKIDNLKFGIYHGTDAKKRQKMIDSKKFDVCIFGHTHQKENYVDEKTVIVLNPGTAHYPVKMNYTHDRYFGESTIMIFDTNDKTCLIYDL